MKEPARASWRFSEAPTPLTRPARLQGIFTVLRQRLIAPTDRRCVVDAPEQITGDAMAQHDAAPREADPEVGVGDDSPFTDPDTS
jgi:hypothetical protein